MPKESGPEKDMWYFCVYATNLLEWEHKKMFLSMGTPAGKDIKAGALRHLASIRRKPTRDVASQTAPPEKPVANSVSTQTPTAPARTYAAAAVQATPPTRRQEHQATPPKHRKSQERERRAQQGARQPPTTPKTPIRPPGRARPPPAAPATKGSPSATRALVMHAAPLKYMPGTMRRWIEEDNKGVKILGIRWLLKEDRREQVASSLVIYLKDPVESTRLRMGRRLFRTTVYDWDR